MSICTLTRQEYARHLERAALPSIVALATRHTKRARYIESHRSRLAEAAEYLEDGEYERAVASAVVALDHAVGPDHPDYLAAVRIACASGCADYLFVESVAMAA